MAPSLVQALVSGTSTTSPLTLTLGAGTSAGSGLIVTFEGSGSTTNPTITGITLGGSADHWAQSGTVGNTSTDDMTTQQWADLGCATGQTSVVISWSGSGTTSVVATVGEFSGLATSSGVDQVGSAVNDSATTTWSSTAAGTNSASGDLAVGCAGTFNSSGIGTMAGPSSPWTNGTQKNSASTHLGLLTGYEVLASSSAPSYAGTFGSPTTGNAYAALIVTYKAAPGVSVALTTPNISLAAPALTPSVPVSVALTAPNLALAAPVLTPSVPPWPAAGTQLDARLELNAGGTWVNVTSDAEHGPWTTVRGHPDESTTVSPATFSATLSNTTARYSPDNVMSDLWPWCVQNMPVRVSIPAASNYLRLEAGNSDCALAADNSAMHVTGSLEVRWYGRLSDWQGCMLACRNDSTSTGSWGLILRGDGTLRFFWYDSSNVEWQSPSDAPLPFVSGDFAVKVTMDATTGTLTFYTAASIDGTYTQLGDALAVTSGAATSVRAGSDPLRAGWSPGSFSDIGSGSTVQMYGRCYEVRLYSGIGGTLKADGQFSAQAAGSVSWTGADGLSWSVSGGAEISSRDYRGHFEASEWPQQEPEYNADSANNTSVEVDALVPLVGGGLLRRLSQRAPDVQSAMYRAILAQTGSLAPPAYWPMEDAAGSTSFGSAVGGSAMTWTGGPPVLAKDTSFACSDPLPVLTGAQFSGPVSYTTGGGGTWTVRWLMDMPTLPGSLQTVMQVNVSGGLGGYAAMAVDSSGFVYLSVLAPDGVTSVASFGPITWTGGVNQPLWWSMEAQPAAGGKVQYSLVSLQPGEGLAGDFSVTTTATGSAGYVNLVLPGSLGDFPDTVIGHLQVQSAWVSLFSLAGPLNAHLGEAAGTRFARLCSENSIACRTRGNLADTTLMGVQPSGTLTTLLQAAADADQGVWTELRQQLGWGYVTRKALYNQVATAVLSYLSDHLSMWSTPPTRDDQTVVNDVTMTADDGSSYRMFAAPGQPVTGGRMSTASPANGGIGTYAQSYSVSVASDSQLPDLCGWKLNLGTVDQARLPGIVIDLASTDATSIYNAVVQLDLGDRLVIGNPPRRLGFMPVTQLAQAFTETLFYDTLTIGIAGVPELPYEVWNEASRVAPNAAILSTGVNATATSWSVAADSNDATQLWSTVAGDYPQNWVVDGEEVTCTAMSGSSSPQTATVTRSVNGVTKSHLASAAITLWPPPVIGL